jgi:hypothetical protein
MKYFFLTEGWNVGRVWEEQGLWNETAWRRQPEITKLPLSVVEKGEKFWLYQVEDAVLMVEVKPSESSCQELAPPTIGQVVLKRLISAEQVLTYLCTVSTILRPSP